MPKVPETPARARRGEVQEAVESLLRREPNLTGAEAVKRLPACNPASVHSAYNALKKAAPTAPTTLDAIAQRKAEITRCKAEFEAQIAAEQARVEAQEKALREAQTPKVQVFGNNGETRVRIACDGQSMVIKLEAAHVLKTLLPEKLQGEHGTAAA